MADTPHVDITALLIGWAGGDRRAFDDLIPHVYQELRRIAHRELRREAAQATLGTTALVHEAYLRLVDQKKVHLESRLHFLNVAAHVMRRVLVDAARKRQAGKRTPDALRVVLDEVNEPRIQPDENLLDLDAALSRLEAFDPRMSRLVELRYFGGLTLEESAEILGMSTTSAWRDWNAARAWLYGELTGRPPEGVDGR